MKEEIEEFKRINKFLTQITSNKKDIQMKIKEHYYEQTEFEQSINLQSDHYDHEWMVYFSTPFDRDGNFITEEDIFACEEEWQLKQLIASNGGKNERRFI